ncbi:MAG: hypothetical protein MAG453_00503 [Calditrichaeota bacterium]|nr:hypothetical protein [Calditrichota bacterium]
MAARVGRPPKKREPVVKVTIALFHRQRVQLDRRVLDIQERQISDIDRSAIIRATIDAVFMAGPDLTEAATEEDLVNLISDAFEGGKRGKTVTAEQPDDKPEQDEES